MKLRSFRETRADQHGSLRWMPVDEARDTVGGVARRGFRQVAGIFRDTFDNQAVGWH